MKDDANGDKASSGRTDEFDRFRDLTRKLVKVPKREIEAERAKTNGVKPKP